MFECILNNVPFRVTGIWLLLSGAVGFFAMGIDKARAIGREWRVREVTVFTMSFIGGFWGVLLGSWLFHHKTSKVEFTLIVLLSAAVWLVPLSRIGFIQCLSGSLPAPP